MTRLQKTGGIIEELDQEKVTFDVKSIKRVERKRTYAELLSKVVSNTVGTNSKPKNTDKKKTMEPNFSKANCSLRGENIHFSIENKMSDKHQINIFHINENSNDMNNTELVDLLLLLLLLLMNLLSIRQL